MKKKTAWVNGHQDTNSEELQDAPPRTGRGWSGCCDFAFFFQKMQWVFVALLLLQEYFWINHISQNRCFFCPRSWNGFIKPKIGIPLVQIQPIRDPFVTHAHCEEIPGAAGPDALHFADRVADQLLVPWLLGKAPCLTEGYPYNGNSY